MLLRPLAFAAVCLALAAPSPAGAPPVAETPPIRVVVWDEQQPKQKEAYDHFLGNAIADHLGKLPGIAVRSVKMDDPEFGLPDATLDACDVLIWWGHLRNKEVPPAVGAKVVERLKAGKLSLIALHSAHWAAPFIQAMEQRSIEDALKSLTDDERKAAKVNVIRPRLYVVPKKDAPPTPPWKKTVAADGTISLDVTFPTCIFPAYRNDGKPSHLTTAAADHPIARGIPATFDLPQTEMYAEPFNVPTPDVVVFQEKWDKGEHFRAGMVWTVGRGKVFYFRPGHETYPIYKQEVPLKILENAVRWMGTRE